MHWQNVDWSVTSTTFFWSEEWCNINKGSFVFSCNTPLQFKTASLERHLFSSLIIYFPLSTLLHPFTILNGIFSNSRFALYYILQFRRWNSLCNEWQEVNGTIQSICARCTSWMSWRSIWSTEIWIIYSSCKYTNKLFLLKTLNTRKIRSCSYNNFQKDQRHIIMIMVQLSVYFSDAARWFSIIQQSFFVITKSSYLFVHCCHQLQCFKPGTPSNFFL